VGEVAAVGVEPDTSVENTQLTDSENASIAENGMISKSAVQPLYKDCQEFPELQPSDLFTANEMHSEVLLEHGYTRQCKECFGGFIPPYTNQFLDPRLFAANLPHAKG
jgi:hypothetical protein